MCGLVFNLLLLTQNQYFCEEEDEEEEEEKVMKLNKISKQANIQSIKGAVLNKNFTLSQVSL